MTVGFSKEVIVGKKSGTTGQERRNLMAGSGILSHLAGWSFPS